MTPSHIDAFKRLPSLRALYIFESAARHCNLVRAAAELGVTQGALSRHIRTLEDHIGVPLFTRTSRGLKLTEAGDLLWTHCERAFDALRSGLGAVAGVRGREQLVLAVARSYATRVLSHRVASFTEQYPWINLVVDGHRHLSDLSQNQADAAIRVGDGRWSDADAEKLEDDPLFPVAAPSLVKALGTNDVLSLAAGSTVLHYSERPDWQRWAKGAAISLPSKTRDVLFSETVMMLEAAEAGQGVAMARRSLVREALGSGQLLQLSDIMVDDGIGYYFCTTDAGRKKKSVQQFRSWLFTKD
jgi:DNA-binding transcriptional LysR family regulator